MPRHDAMGDRQAEPGPVADRLGREEGVEDVGQVLRRDAAAVVGHLDENLPADGPARDADASALRPSRGLDGLQRVDEQVEQDLRHLARRAAQLRHARAVALHRDPATLESAADHLQAHVDEIRVADGFYLRRSAARYSTHRLYESVHARHPRMTASV